MCGVRVHLYSFKGLGCHYVVLSYVHTFSLGLLYTIGNQFFQYTPTESVTLKINVASTDISYNFRALTWFHNGMEVIPNERIVITDFNKTVMISNTTDDDSGVYEVKFTGLFIHPYSKYCEQDILSLLRHYPIAMPTHYYLYKNNTPGKLIYNQY